MMVLEYTVVVRLLHPTGKMMDVVVQPGVADKLCVTGATGDERLGMILANGAVSEHDILPLHHKHDNR